MGDGKTEESEEAKTNAMRGRKETRRKGERKEEEVGKARRDVEEEKTVQGGCIPRERERERERQTERKSMERGKEEGEKR